jgi:hypothetical protein
MAETRPDELTGATDGLALDHVPAAVASVSNDELPKHRLKLPEIALTAGKGLTVSMFIT